MTGLEIPAFAVGLTGLEVIFKRGCLIWKTIKEAEDFGDDIAECLCRLEMEFFKFVSWWTTIERLAKTDATSAASKATTSLPSSLDGPLAKTLQENLTNPIVNGAESITRLLSDIQDILQRNGSLRTVQQRSISSSLPPQTQLDSLVGSTRHRRDAFIVELKRGTSWFKRLKYDATPWRDADKGTLKEKTSSIEYWNRNLYCILPQAIRDSLQWQGISAFLLDNVESADDVQTTSVNANQGDSTVAQNAALLTLRQRFETGNHDTSDPTCDLATLNLTDDVHGLACSFYHSSKFSTARAASSKGVRPEQEVLLEWFPYPPSSETEDYFNEAKSRWAQLSYLLRYKRPSTLHTLETLGYVENDEYESFGLVYSIPRHYTTDFRPITLHNLLLRMPTSREDGIPLTEKSAMPNLEQRMMLASALASSLYTFMLARWHHESFTTKNIFFLFQHDLGDSAAPIADLEHPYVGGFGIARPDSPDEKSFGLRKNHELDEYLHPDLRTLNRPKYLRLYDIYSFGLVLFEIGFWQPLVRVMGSSTTDPSTCASPKEFRRRVIQKCQSDLACWAGKRFCQVTLQCLKVGTHGGLEEDLAGFYEKVVFELARLVSNY